MKDLSQAEKQDLQPGELLQYFFAEILEDHEQAAEKSCAQDEPAAGQKDTASLLQFF